MKDKSSDKAAEEQAPPLVRIVMALRLVADGGEAAWVRDVVRAALQGETKERARELFNKIVRMRDAAEVAVTVATEETAAIENRPA